MNRLDSILYEFLVKETGMPNGEFQLLTEEVKTETLIQLAHDVLESIQKKLPDVDTVAIDRTRGEIKNFVELPTIQNVVTKLTNLAFSYSETVSPELPKYLKEITKSIYNLNKYSGQFKDAYRGKKTLLILRYQSVILSIISALSYLVSISIDFKGPGIKLRDNISIEEILPLKSLIDFNKSIETGAFDISVKDTASLREFYVEYTVEEMATIYEAVDIVSLINNGINSFTGFFNNGNRNGLIFKALGVVMIILSLRDIFYSLYNSKTKISEKLNHLKTFLNFNNLSSSNAVSKFITFNNKNIVDAENTTEIVKKEIAAENKEIINNVRSKPNSFEMETQQEFIPVETTEVAPSTKDSDIFAGFNF